MTTRDDQVIKDDDDDDGEGWVVVVVPLVMNRLDAESEYAHASSFLCLSWCLSSSSFCSRVE
jgi:hypothetical protein